MFTGIPRLLETFIFSFRIQFLAACSLDIDHDQNLLTGEFIFNFPQTPVWITKRFHTFIFSFFSHFKNKNMCNGHKYLSFLKIIAVFANAGPDVCKCRLFSHHRVKHFHQVKNRACLREAEKKFLHPPPPS